MTDTEADCCHKLSKHPSAHVDILMPLLQIFSPSLWLVFLIVNGFLTSQKLESVTNQPATLWRSRVPRTEQLKIKTKKKTGAWAARAAQTVTKQGRSLGEEPLVLTVPAVPAHHPGPLHMSNCLSSWLDVTVPFKVPSPRANKPLGHS